MLPLLLVLTAATSDVTSGSSCSKVATFNTALTHWVDKNYESRIDDVTEALDRLDADLVCLQEVWLESDMQKILDKLGGKYPNHYSKIHSRQGELRKPKSLWEKVKSILTVHSPCSVKDIWVISTQVMPCAYKKDCLSTLSESSQKALQCISKLCRPALMKVQSGCLSCVATMSAGISQVSEACFPDLLEKNNAMNPPGLLLLSKTPMTGLKYQDYNPGTRSILTRGTLEAEVDGVGKVVCTHLTKMFPVYFEYDLDFVSFESQHHAEIHSLLRSYGDQPHLLMGDLNTGPVVVNTEDRERNLNGEEEDNFKKLLRAGYSSRYLETDGRCTLCLSNPLRTKSSPTLNGAIDHILSKNDGPRYVRTAKRVLDQVKPRPLSDHFGVMAEVCPDQ